MRTRKKIILSAGLLIFSLTVHAHAEEIVSLSLEDCIVRALKDNLNIAVEIHNPGLAEARLSRSKEIFLPQWEVQFGNERNESASSWWLQGEDTSFTKYFNLSTSIVQQIPTGGRLSLSLSNFRTETNQLFQNYNPYYQSTLRFEATQPLLKNFGFKVNRKEILIARNNLDISFDQFKTVVLDTIYLVQEAYWNLVYAIEDHKVKQQSLDLAKDLLAKTRKEVEVGRLAEIEILNAEAVVASREADILQAEALIRSYEDRLMNILNMTVGSEFERKRIHVLDKPEYVEKDIILREAIDEALSGRPDIRIKQKTIETNHLNLSVAKNQLLPGLDFSFSYWSPGLSGDRLHYLNDNPLTGVVVGKEEGGAGQAISDAFHFLYNNWSIGLTLSIPINTIFSRADYTVAKMELEKSLVELENLKRQAVVEVRDAFRSVETNARRYQAYKVSKELAAKRLKAEEKKLNVGLTTNYFVLEYQEALAEAQTQELKALIDYNLALAQLEKALGASFEKRNIRISDFQIK